MIGPQEIVERALERSKADGCLVIVDDETTANLRWANSYLTTDGVSASRRVTVIAAVEQAAGVGVGAVSGGVAEGGSLDDLVAAAEDTARQAAPAPDAEPLVSSTPDSPHWMAPVPETEVGVFAGVAPALGEAFAASRARGEVLFGYVEHRMHSTFLGSSTGIRLRHDQPSGHIELTGRSVSGGESAWVGAATKDFSDVSVAALYHQVHGQLGLARRRVELPAGRYECVLPPAAVADLMNHVYWSAGARDALAGQTVYSKAGGATRVGERLSEVPLTLRGDPYAPGLECAPFLVTRSSDATVSVFDNGLALQPTAWIDRGVLNALLQTRHTARDNGLPLAPRIDNLILDGAGAGSSLDDLVASTQRALLVTSFWYIRDVDEQTLLLTGLTRDGAYLIEGGEIVGAVNNFRFNESPVGMLARVREVGATVPTRAREWGDAFTCCAMPPLRVADFNMSSVSRAT